MAPVKDSSSSKLTKAYRPCQDRSLIKRMGRCASDHLVCLAITSNQFTWIECLMRASEGPWEVVGDGRLNTSHREDRDDPTDWPAVAFHVHTEWWVCQMT